MRRGAGTRRRLASTALLAAFAAPATCATPVARAAAPPAHAGPLDATVRYLQEDQNADGGFGGEPKATSSADFTAWAALALAAAGVNPRSQARPGGASAYAYLSSHAGELSLSTDYERELLVVDATGVSPADFGGVDLVGELLGRRLTAGAEAGAFVHEAGSARAGVNDTIFAILSLSPLAEPAAHEAVQAAATWLEREQDADGSWPATCLRTIAGCGPPGGEPQGEVDMTGAAIQALGAAGRRGGAAEQRALAYLHAAQSASEGGFAEHPGEAEANVASTAWAVQALWSAGVDPEAWSPRAGVDPLDYLEAMQQPDGHVRWKRGADVNGVWMTAYVTPALAGDAWPIAAPAYTPPPQAQPPAPQADGGEGGDAGSGVIAGGGGDGAPLFSRPQPQSTGTTPGGARVLAGRSARRRRATRNPGAARRGPVPTIAAAPARAAASARHGGARPHGGGRETDGESRGRTGPRKVRGVLVDAAAANASTGRSEAGAPGLRSAAAGTREAASIALGIAGAGALLALLGTQLERRRPGLPC